MLVLFADRVYGIHFKDVNKDGHEVAIGEGELDIPRFLETLKRIGYSYPITLQAEGNPEDPMPYLKKCLEKTRQIFANMS